MGLRGIHSVDRFSGAGFLKLFREYGIIRALAHSFLEKKTLILKGPCPMALSPTTTGRGSRISYIDVRYP